MSEAEVNALPDPDLFRDAQFLSVRGTWSAADLDSTDALLLSLIRTFLTTQRKSD